MRKITIPNLMSKLYFEFFFKVFYSHMSKISISRFGKFSFCSGKSIQTIELYDTMNFFRIHLKLVGMSSISIVGMEDFIYFYFCFEKSISYSFTSFVIQATSWNFIYFTHEFFIQTWILFYEFSSKFSFPFLKS